jgi:ribosomal subunit interface protein
MTELTIRNLSGPLSDQDTLYIQRKLNRLSKTLKDASRVEVVHEEEKLGHQVTVTVFSPLGSLRGEERNGSLRAAVDLVIDKIKVRAARAKEKQLERERD